MTDLLQCTFRAGSGYELVPFDRLSATEKLLLSDLCKDPDFYGVLRPSDASSRTVKAVGKDTALLWLTLQSPGPLPFYILNHAADAALSSIPSLLLDGVLEVEMNGRFVGGPDVTALLTDSQTPVPAPPLTRLGTLSLNALMYGESLLLKNTRDLAVRLYSYGKHPVTPDLYRLLPNGEAVLKFLGAPAGSRLRHLLDTVWQPSANDSTPAWLSWSSRKQFDLRGDAVPKLYISPMMESLPQVFQTVVGLTNPDLRHFKVGSDASGLLRPDKLVLYFTHQEALYNVASELASQLRGVSPHGVPFSSEISSDGLLSWGMDPPESARMVTWQEPESWRLWIVRRLAAAMVTAQAEGSPKVRAGTFALERLRHEGVDVVNWTPSPALWQKN